jgi:hypothetical protein
MKERMEIMALLRDVLSIRSHLRNAMLTLRLTAKKYLIARSRKLVIG